jgi:hypothetical protein
LISDLLPNRRLVDIFEAVTNHDDRAAVVCALTSLCVVAGRYSSVGDRQGWIILPPWNFIQPWAWSLSSKTRKARVSLYLRTHSARYEGVAADLGPAHRAVDPGAVLPLTAAVDDPADDCMPTELNIL